MDLGQFIHSEHQLIFIIISFLIAYTASITSIDSAKQIHLSNGLIKHAWILTGGAVLGIGIWSMHFVSMLSYPFSEQAYFDKAMSAYSVIIAVLSCVIGFYSITFMKHKLLALFLGGITIGTGTFGMHYIGMSAMKSV
ncbi:hypothetical protein F9U64_00465, partial [Gracilibacillus oryzae]